MVSLYYMRKILFIATTVFALTCLSTSVTIYAEAPVVKPIKILIIPGHDNTAWGAQYRDIKEADMSLALGTQIYDSLKKDKRFDVVITRDKDGYVKEFQDYFDANKDKIIAFKEEAKAVALQNISAGKFLKKKGVLHTSVSEDVAIKLYGVNKWANENNVDAIINIHFNDDSRNNKKVPGKYKGFSIYMPDSQMKNSKQSIYLAKSISAQLSKKYLSNNYKNGKGGLIFDQTLIALGANGTLNQGVMSILIEYGFIYDKKFRTLSTRKATFATMAKNTVDGITNLFFKKKLSTS